ncbi:MAG TPA: AmmeMemoRadiSam system protein B, partial [Paludibacteraceae bacterium]|nr:AmmeMemoRadiSam system protein B [Paludibacteraceae bacterium]
MEKFNETIDRRPAVAGKFYPANVEELQKEIDIFFKNAAPKQLDRVRAIICPHAGYVFSGKITASAFNQIDANREYKRIFLIGSSH